VSEHDVRQLLVHSAVWPRLVAWLASNGIVVVQLPPSFLELEGEGLPTYIMSPMDWPEEEL
jgi:trans-aconitate methyltransferase